MLPQPAKACTEQIAVARYAASVSERRQVTGRRGGVLD
jgi:hypothetical protein